MYENSSFTLFKVSFSLQNHYNMYVSMPSAYETKQYKILMWYNEFLIFCKHFLMYKFKIWGI